MEVWLKHKIYVYGTLRPGTGETVDVPGLLYDLGWFPGAQSLLDYGPDYDGPTFKCEVIEVDDKELRRLDYYEGYNPDNPYASLYVRKPYLDGYIYIYNGSFGGRTRIESGDWLSYKGQSKGVAA